MCCIHFLFLQTTKAFYLCVQMLFLCLPNKAINDANYCFPSKYFPCCKDLPGFAFDDVDDGLEEGEGQVGVSGCRVEQQEQRTLVNVADLNKIVPDIYS